VREIHEPHAGVVDHDSIELLKALDLRCYRLSLLALEFIGVRRLEVFETVGLWTVLWGTENQRGHITTLGSSSSNSR